MVLLRSKDNFDSLAELDTATGEITWFSRHVEPLRACEPIRGAIVQMSGRVLCLYREAEGLHLRVDDEVFELTETTEVSLKRIGRRVNRITVVRDRAVLFTWDYERPLVQPPLEDDPTPFVEEEDFDFGLFVYNVANDSERKERIYR